MSRSIDIDHELDSWITDGPTALPDRAVDAIVRQVEGTQQQGLLWPLGGTRMNRTFYAIAGFAAVLVLVASTGWYLGWFGNAPGIGGPLASASPSPILTAAPTVTTTSGPSAPPATLAAASVPAVNFTSLAPGRYLDATGGFDYTLDVPAGWMSAGSGGLIINGSNFNRGSDDFAADSPDFAAISLPRWWANPADSRIVYTDPCRSLTTATSTGTSAADLVAALRKISPMSPTVPETVHIGAYTAQHIRLTVPADADFSTCDGGKYWSLPGRFSQGPGQVDNYWIVDLPGGKRQLIGMSYMPGTTQVVRDQLPQMVDSLSIEPS
jgi:hypothetical protein